MTALLDAIARAFVVPAAQDRPRAAAAAAAPAAAVYGPAAEPVACALALAARPRGAAVVCVWQTGGRRPVVAATPRARRVAASMAARGLTARASGRLVLVALDDAPVLAAAQAQRAAAAAGDATVVLAMAGPRQEAFDGLLAAQDVAVLAAGEGPPELLRLGVAALAATGRRAVWAQTPAGAAAWLARAGLVATPGARRAVASATELLS